MARPLNCWKCRKPKSQCKCWRPTVFTEDVIQKLEEIFKIDWTVVEATSYAWVWHNSYYEQLKKNPVFKERMEKAQLYPFIKAKKKLQIQMEDKENPMIAHKATVEFLKRREKRYSDKLQSDETVTNVTLTMDDLDKMTPEEIEKLRREKLGLN